MPDTLPDLPNTGSSLQPEEIPHHYDYAVKGENRLISVLYKKVEEMEKKVHDLETKQIIDQTQLPMEIIEANNLLPPKPYKLKRGRGYRPILKSEIEEAMKHSPYAAGAARWMGVAMITFKRYAKMYGIYKPNPNAPGKRNLFDPNRGTYPLNKILNGDYKDELHVTDWIVKDKLIRSGLVKPECAICGYRQRRITDNKMAILLDHKDGDKRNFKLENLQLLCYNCTFECGRGFIRHGKHMFDADWMQGAPSNEIDPKARW